jgi:hypothetical protein
VVQELLAYFLVVTEAGTAVNDREVAILVGLGKIAQRHRGLSGGIRSRRGVVVPGGAGGLFPGILVVETQLTKQPEDRSGVSGNVAALAARLVMPGVVEGDLLLGTRLGLDLHRLLLLGDPMDDQLALLFQLEQLLLVLGLGQGRPALEHPVLGLGRWARLVGQDVEGAHRGLPPDSDTGPSPTQSTTDSISSMS